MSRSSRRHRLAKLNRVNADPAFRRFPKEKDTMNSLRASVAAIAIASLLTSTLAFSKSPEPAPASNSSSTAATPPSSATSDADRVKNWTEKEWNEAVKEWAQDKSKWAGCRTQSAAKRLSGRKSWSFLYGCMTE
jgi:hypothetical protein